MFDVIVTKKKFSIKLRETWVWIAKKEIRQILLLIIIWTDIFIKIKNLNKIDIQKYNINKFTSIEILWQKM